jgi:hypothetical protein
MDPNGKMMGLQLILAGVLAKTIQKEGGDAPAALNRLKAELLNAADSVGMNDLPGANSADVRASARQTIEETFSLLKVSQATVPQTGQG